jgi:hypothetical protein
MDQNVTVINNLLRAAQGKSQIIVEVLKYRL